MRRPLLICTALLGSFSVGAQARDLSFNDRVAAQEALERVYYAHQIGAWRPFDAAVPRSVLEAKVLRYMRQSVALEQRWHTPITAEMLAREIGRMAASSRMPDRLRELFSALGDDGFLVQECLARPALVERLTGKRLGSLARDPDPTVRSFDEWWTAAGSALDPLGVVATASADALLPEIPRVGCVPDDVWDNGSLDDVPEARDQTSGIWTGSLMVVWGGSSLSGSQNTGGRYDPATDTWTPTSTAGAPAPRYSHTAVWTGGRMVVWGGYSSSGHENTGGRYDPASDSWTPTSALGAPPARSNHTAVWTGLQMIVWGGKGSGGPLDNGRRYDPTADTWSGLASAGAPQARYLHTAVWAHGRMVVWGGYGAGDVELGSGGRYDPIADAWMPTSTLGAPSARVMHAAVSTGAQMIVWGGDAFSGGLQNTGGRYDPTTDVWTPTSTLNAPAKRRQHTAVWTGSRAIVWGGSSTGSFLDKAGGSYDPAADSWTPTATANAPEGRRLHVAVWTGSLMVVWGGDGDQAPLATGGRLDPAAGSWTPVSTAGAPAGRYNHTAVWTGSLMIVYGGAFGAGPGGRYDPALDVWTPVSTVGAAPGTDSHTAVWTGQEMIAWGGLITSGAGARYDPIADVWTPTSMLGAPAKRARHAAVWTGDRMVVWGGRDGWQGPLLNSGGRYDPLTDTWTPASVLGAPAARWNHTAVWTGKEMIVWGGADASTSFNDGARYDPQTDSWASVASTALLGRTYHTAVWTGSRMIVWGGQAGLVKQNTGGRYDPQTDSWSLTSLAGAPSPRGQHTAVWTGGRMIVWGGGEVLDPLAAQPTGAGPPVNTGGVYNPRSDSWSPTTLFRAPPPRRGHSAVWSGSLMVVWGGQPKLFDGGRYAWGQADDDDADGFSECDGDCDDADALIHPGGIEYCDGQDNDCDSLVDEGTTLDRDGDGLSACNGDCDDADPGQGATAFPDCNGNGVPEGCEIAVGVAHDCDGNGVPDACDVECSGNCDADRDGCLDGRDAEPDDPLACGDVDQDTCDDCSAGTFGPASDGIDADADGACDSGDCASLDSALWAAPGPVLGPTLAKAGSVVTLEWQAPVSPGAATVVYDVLRSPSASDFSSAVCLEQNDTDHTAVDPDALDPGDVRAYLVRVENGCGAEMGQDSAGLPHEGPACPP